MTNYYLYLPSDSSLTFLYLHQKKAVHIYHSLLCNACDNRENENSLYGKNDFHLSPIEKMNAWNVSKMFVLILATKAWRTQRERMYYWDEKFAFFLTIVTARISSLFSMLSLLLVLFCHSKSFIFFSFFITFSFSSSRGLHYWSASLSKQQSSRRTAGQLRR